jgi:hypothetical protein
MRFRLLSVLFFVVAGACDTSGAVFSRPMVDPERPAQMTPGDAGVPGPIAPPETTCAAPAPKNDILVFAGETNTVSLGTVSCALSTFRVEVLGPDQRPVAAEPKVTCAALCTLAVEFAPGAPGIHVINAVLPGNTPVRRGAFAATLAPPIAFTTTTFVDRMDTCDRGPYRSTSGFTFCERNQVVAVYGPDGQRVGVFGGIQLAVHGDDVWSLPPDGRMELRRAGASLDVVGRGTVSGLGDFFDPTLEGDAVQYSSRSGSHIASAKSTPSGLSETLTSVTFSEYPGSRSFVLEPGTGPFILPNLCLATPGCQAPLSCPPVVRCGSNELFVNVITPAAVYGVRSTARFEGGTTIEIQAIARPLRAQLAPFAALILDLPQEGWAPVQNGGVDLPAFFTGRRAVFVRLQANGQLLLTAVAIAGNLHRVTDDALVTSDLNDPFRLSFAQPPVTYRRPPSP